MEAESDRTIIRVRPYADGPGREYAEEVISTFHTPLESPSFWERVTGNDKEPPRFSYELWYNDGQLEFHWTVPDDFWYEKIRNDITGNYPRLSLNRAGNELPAFDDTDHIAGGTLSLYNNQFVPVKGMSRTGHFEPEKAPLRVITTEIAGQPDTTVLVQVVFEPAPDNWRTNTPLGTRTADRVASHYKEGQFVHSFVNPRIEDPTEKDHRIARAINNHAGDPAFYTTIRYLVFAPSKEQAQNQAASIGSVYRSTYNNRELNQRFEQNPLTGDALFDELTSAVTREHTGNEMPLTVPELAAVAHLPNDDIETPAVAWTRRALTSRAPSEAPRKPETIDARPYEQFGPEAATGDHLSANAPQLSPAEGAPEDPPPDENYALDDDADDNADAEQTDTRPDPSDYTTEPRPGTNPEFGRPRKQVETSKQTEFDKIVRAVEQDKLSLKELHQKYGGDPESDRLISLIEQELEWRKTAPENVVELSFDDDSDDESERFGRQTGTPNNLPTKPGDYEEYPFKPDGFEREWMKDPHTKDDRAYEIAVKHDPPGADEEWYMGRDVKNELFDIHAEYPDSPIWLGWMKDNRVGVREIGLPKNAWFRHMTLFGMTGTGKSTFENNLMNQVARKGYGFVYIDPKGDGVEDVLQQLPEDRLEDDEVIWIEPGSIEHDKVVGINFLEPAYDSDHPKYDREVASIVDDLTAILKGGDYWGPKMEGITTNIARAMIRSGIDYTLLDMYFVLLGKRERQAFVEAIERERRKRQEQGDSGTFVQDMKNISTYTRQIAEMDQDEVDAVIRRIQHWVEDPIARGIVAHREGTVNITEAVEEGKIILVSIDVDSADIKEVVTTAIMRRVWAAIKARDEDEQDREPFFSFIDEFDDVVTPEMDIEKMLSKARSGKMGVNLACQNPSQIPEAPLDQMFNNARTLNTFSIGGPDDSVLISKRLSDEVEPHQVREIPQYTIYTRVLINTEDGNQLSEPLALNTFADYPPQRSRKEAHEVIDESLETYGVEPLEETLEESTMILYDMGSNIDIQRGFLQSVWQLQIERNEEYVALSAVGEAFHERVGNSLRDYPEGITIDTEWVEIFEPVEDNVDPEAVVERMKASSTDEATAELADSGYRKVEDDGAGEIRLNRLQGVARITDAGKKEVLSADEHRARPTETHRELLGRGAFEWFTRAGFKLNVLAQVSSHSEPDAEGLLPVPSATGSLADAQRSWERLQEEYPLVAELSGGREIAIEAEVSLRKPAGPLQNIARAANNNRRPIFIVPDGRREDLIPSDVNVKELTYWARRLYNIIKDPLLVRHFNSYEDDDGRVHTTRTLYNTQDHLSLASDEDEQKFALVRKNKQCVWQDHDGDYLILYDGAGDDGKQRGRLTPEQLEDPSVNAFETWCRYDKYEDEWVVYPEQGGNKQYGSLDDLEDEWQRVYRPFHPETEIDCDITEIDPFITILRDPDHIESLEDAMPAIYTHPDERDDSDVTEAKLEPLIPEAYHDDWETDLIPGFDPIEQTPEFLEEDEEQPLKVRLADAFTDRELMNTDNISSGDDLEAALAEIDEYDPTHEPSHDFGGKDPTARSLWRNVWDQADEHHEQPLELESLKDGLTAGAAIAPENHEAAIKAGVHSGQLIPSDVGYFLARPSQRPRVVVGDPETYTKRAVWKDIWDKSGFEEDEAVPENVLVLSANGIGPFTGDQATKTAIRAGINIGIDTEALEESDEGIVLGTRDIPSKWKALWNELGAEIDEPVNERYAAPALRGLENLDSVDDAKNHIKNAIERRVLYETENGIRINDPATDEGPPLSPSDNGDNDDDDSEQTSNENTPDTGDSTATDDDNTDADTDGQSASEPASTPGEASDDATASAEASSVDISLTNPDLPDDYTPAPGVGAGEAGKPDDDSESTATAADDSDTSLFEQWRLAPTEAPPDGWQAAFQDAIDAYQDRLDDPIEANDLWNSLVDDYRDRVHAAAACDDHSRYVAECNNCVPTAACHRCDDGRSWPILRVEWESCANHDDVPRADCSQCIERQYCHQHATDRREDTNVAADTDLDPGGPLEYIELITCYSCDEFKATADTDATCYCETHAHAGPLQRLPETARDYFTGPDWSDDDSLPEGDYAETANPHRHRGRHPDTIGRGWDDKIVDERHLGWVPGTKPYERAIVDDLLDAGHSIEALLATGLFRPHLRRISKKLSDGDPNAYTLEDLASDDIDLKARISHEDEAIEAADVLQPEWSGRPIFPALNSDGEAVFAYVRKQPSRQHPDDIRDAKYLKIPVSRPYVWADEPIYGVDTLAQGTPTIITEGVADAIAAHSHGLPCLSPVTTQFKDKHHGPLLQLLEEYDIDTVLLIQDNEPGSFAPLAEADYDSEAVAEAIEKRERWLDSDSQDLAEHIDEHSGRGPIGKAMEIDGVGPGLAGALSTGEFLEANGVTAVQVELPRFGAEKVDLDDYLTGGLCEYAPPLQSFNLLLQVTSQTTTRAIGELLVEANALTKAYTNALTSELEALDEDALAKLEPSEWPDTELGEYPEPEQTWPLYTARETARERVLNTADPSVTDADDFDLQPVRDAKAPDSFDSGLLGTLLGLGESVIPVPGLAVQPRQPREPLCRLDDPTAVGETTAIPPTWFLALDAIIADSDAPDGVPYGTAVELPASLDVTEIATQAELPSHDLGMFVELTPLLEGPEMYVPSEHPQFEQVIRDRATAERDQYDDTDAGVDEPQADSGRSITRRNQLYQLTLRQVSGKDDDYRGKNPLGHVGNSKDYYVMLGKDVAYDHKRKVTYNGLTYLVLRQP
jgi:hypothetical protein